MTLKHTLSKARQYEEKYLNVKKDKPLFHMACPVGWMNDPNGFSMFNNRCHLFFQYNPYDTVWGPMHWGHAVSEDFIRWEHLPAALAPDQDYDNCGCFSGSGIEADGKHVLLYTGVHKGTAGTSFEDKVIQEQCVAIGDGINYKKMDYGPVITSNLLPDGHSLSDFRDPKVYRWNGKYRAVIGNTDTEKQDGFVVVFESDNLKDWNYIGVLDASNDEYGSMWECPDLFELDDKAVLIVSPQFIEAKGLEFHNGHNTMCIVGTIEDEKMEREFLHAIDYGLDFYAPQTLESADGRRVMIGWLQSWDNHIVPSGFNWSGMMTIPRELTVTDGRLYQIPVRELYHHRKNEIICEADIDSEECFFDGINGRVFDMELDFINMDGSSLEIKLACDERHQTVITIDKDKRRILFDRTYSGLNKDVLCTRTMQVDRLHGGSSMRILMDRFSVELFVNGGRYAMSSLIYTPLKADQIVFSSKGKFQFRIKKYDIML